MNSGGTIKGAASPRRRDRLRIVWLEDEPLLIEMSELIIRERFRDFYLVVFPNGDEAWRYLSRQEPDLFITDCCHPGLSGPAVLRKLADRKATFPIIWSCGCPTELHTEDNGHFQLNLSCLQKPFTRNQLLATLDDTLGRTKVK